MQKFLLLRYLGKILTDPTHLATEPAFCLTDEKMGPRSTVRSYTPAFGGHSGKKFLAASQPTSNCLSLRLKKEKKGFYLLLENSRHWKLAAYFFTSIFFRTFSLLARVLFLSALIVQNTARKTHEYDTVFSRKRSSYVYIWK